MQLSVAAQGAEFCLEGAVNELLGRFELRADTSLFTGGALEAQLDVANADSAIDTLSMLQIQARVVAARANLIGVRGERLAPRVNLQLAVGGSFDTHPGI